jgi:hypothetical protein
VFAGSCIEDGGGTKTYPNGVVIKHANLGSGDIFSMYGHLNQQLIRENETLTRGQVIATGLQKQLFDERDNTYLHLGDAFLRGRHWDPNP